MTVQIDDIGFESYSWDEIVDTQLGVDYAAYRGWVYVSVKHFREPDVLDLRGGESDQYDPFSQHFIARNRHDGAIVGCTRVIRNTPQITLPASHHFPGTIASTHINPWSIGEVSRFISTAGSPRLRRNVALLLIRELADHALDRNRNHVVFVVERPLSRWLGSLGVPLEPIGAERWIEEEQGALTPYLVDMKECDRALAATHTVYATPFDPSPTLTYRQR